FAHLIKKMTGRTFLQMLHQIRIQNAQHLLERTAKTCTDIAYECGYNDQSYFIKHFKRLTGQTPIRYRKG
ncbi:MAG: helix-turn-helix transcriptional regulator, partial [Kiritimatiellae bacterium]|nr:helix-turn-helix transcriptional regulator [Kiritimatiellia bacterium]